MAAHETTRLASTGSIGRKQFDCARTRWYTLGCRGDNHRDEPSGITGQCGYAQSGNACRPGQTGRSGSGDARPGGQTGGSGSGNARPGGQTGGSGSGDARPGQTGSGGSGNARPGGQTGGSGSDDARPGQTGSRGDDGQGSARSDAGDARNAGECSGPGHARDACDASCGRGQTRRGFEQRSGKKGR